MPENKPELISIVLPVFCEAENIGALVADVREKIGGLGIDYEFVLVDDGSNDATWSVIEKLQPEFPTLRAARLSRNFGKDLALCAGLEMARGDAVIVMDADGQHPPTLLPEMIGLWRDTDVEIVEGVKTSRGRETIFSKLSAGIFYALWNKLSGFELQGASDYKLLDRCAVDAYLRMNERHVFFRGMTAWLGFKKAQLPFEVAERKGGRSGWSLFKRIRLAVDGISGFSSLPLQMVTLAGVAFLVFAFAFAIQTLARWYSGHSVDGFPTVILLLLIIGSLLMISLGIIGTYLARIYEEIKHRPRFVVAETIDIDLDAGRTTKG
ncbi:MAG: glycosyltransferase family 2 protein [Pyrinomonadaceae bacterium]